MLRLNWKVLITLIDAIAIYNWMYISARIECKTVLSAKEQVPYQHQNKRSSRRNINRDIRVETNRSNQSSRAIYVCIVLRSHYPSFVALYSLKAIESWRRLNLTKKLVNWNRDEMHQVCEFGKCKCFPWRNLFGFHFRILSFQVEILGRGDACGGPHVFNPSLLHDVTTGSE